MHSNSEGVLVEKDPTLAPPPSALLILSLVFIFVALILAVSFPTRLNSAKSFLPGS